MEDGPSADIDPTTFASFNLGDEVEVLEYREGTALIASPIDPEDEQNRVRSFTGLDPHVRESFNSTSDELSLED